MKAKSLMTGAFLVVAAKMLPYQRVKCIGLQTTWKVSVRKPVLAPNATKAVFTKELGADEPS
jgi:hypothetical protein